jgi:hypothetical protein
MATKKSKMSAEEKAVRDAFAAVQADTGLAKAQEIIKTGAVPLPTITAKPTYEESRSLVSQISDPKTRAAFEKAYAGIDVQTEKVRKQYEDLGYVYNPNTGQVTPKGNTNVNTNVNTGGDASGNKNVDIDKDTRNAFAILKQVFSQYGLGDLSSVIETLMKEGYEPEEATLALKTDPRYNKAYITRFRGNELRRSAGLNVLTEAEYLTLEDDYTKTLKSYGLESYFGVDKSIKQSAMADVIGADISAVEFTERVSTAVDRVKMADPATKSAFQQFYGIGEADLVQYFLDPKKALVNLKEKAVSAEIGGAALGQGLTATATSAEDLARFGINREQAQAGYSTIAQELPTAAKLGDIYSETGTRYTQADAESATFKGLASAKRKKEKLVATEEAQFQGSSGVGAAGLSTTYLRRGSSAGQF